MSYIGQFDNCNWAGPYAGFGHPMNASHVPHNGEFLRQMNWTQSPCVQQERFIDNCRGRHNPYAYRNNRSSDSYVPDQNWRSSNRKTHRESHHPYVYNYYHNNYSYLAGRDEFCSDRTSQVSSPNISQMKTFSNRNGPVPFAYETQVDYLSNISFRRTENSRPKDSSTPAPGPLRNHSTLTPNAQSLRPSVPINPCNFPRISLNIPDRRENGTGLLMPVRPGSENTKFIENWHGHSSNSTFPVYSQSTRKVQGLNGAPTEQSYIQNKQALAINHYNKTASTVSELNGSNALYIPVKFLVVTNSQKQNGLSLSMAASQGNPQSLSNAPRICLQDGSYRDSVNRTISEQRSGQVTSSKTPNAIARPVQNWRSNNYNYQTQNSLYSSAPPSQGELRSSWHYPTMCFEDGSQNQSLSKGSQPATDQGIWRTSTGRVNRQVNNVTSQPHHNNTEIGKKQDYLTKSMPPDLVQGTNVSEERPEIVEGSCNVLAGRNIAAEIEENPCQSSHRYNSDCDPDNFIIKTDYFYQEEVQLSTNKCNTLGEGILRNEFLEECLSDVRNAKVEEKENFPGDTFSSKFKEVPLERTLNEDLPGNVKDRASIGDVLQSRDSLFGHHKRRKLEGDYDKKTQGESSRASRIPLHLTSSSFYVSNLKREDDSHHGQDDRREVAFHTGNGNPLVAVNKEGVTGPPCLSTKTTNDVLSKTEILNSPLTFFEDVKCDDVEIDLNDTFTYEAAAPSQNMDEKVVIEDFPLQDFELEKCDDIEIVFTKMKKELLPSPKVECKALVGDENTDEGIKPNELDKPSEPLLNTGNINGEEILSSEDLQLANCDNIDVEEIEFSDTDLRLSPVVEEEVVDRCPKGHFLHPYHATFNLKTGKIVVPCKKCNCIISMKSRVNSL